MVVLLFYYFKAGKDIASFPGSSGGKSLGTRLAKINTPVIVIPSGHFPCI